MHRARRHQPSRLTYLLIQELPGILLNVALIQVGGEAHQPHLGQTEVCQLDVSHGGDQQTVGQRENVCI